MTDEEKKAIERLKGIDIKFFLSGSTEQSDYIVDGADKINIAIETLLNLIEKQQAEIENAYWKGYTARDTEAQNICKSCKYRKP